MRISRSVSRWLAGASCLAVLVPLAACSSGGAKAAGHTGGAPAKSSAAAAGAGSSASASSASSGGAVSAYYISGQPTHEAEILAMGLASFPQVLSAAGLQVKVQALPASGNPAASFLSIVNQTASPSTLVVCACAQLPASVTGAKSNGYALVQQESQTGANFYYSDGATSTVSPALQPLVTVLGTLRTQAVAKGQSYVTSFLETTFGESATHALQTYDSLAGKPVLAAANDLTVDEVDFYPMLGWGTASEYMTQMVTITNPTENDVSGLTIPVPPGATDIHLGTWGATWPPFNGKAATVSGGAITVTTPLPALQTIQISVTYRASSAANTSWPTFTWTLPYAAKKVNVNLASYYVQQGDSVTTNLPAETATTSFAVWSGSNLPAGQTITFQPYAPSRAPLE